jgi:crotonobetainyl-CoA:carnitine CoA-transferase CaiB-like acyl-CoA transferase
VKSETTLPLAGIKVLDLSRVLAGPWATQLLADQGATVLKIERAGAGDDTRQWGPPWWTDDTASYFTCANRGKHSIAADFANPDHLSAIAKLAQEADVVVENFKVGQLKKYGLDAQTLQQQNPGLIYCSVTGYGQTGPRAQEAGYDYALQGFTGLMSITGPAGGEPQKVGVAIIDLVTGLYAAQAISAALVRRERTGQGAVLDCSLLDSGLAILANQASGYLVADKVPKAMGNSHPSIVPYQVYATADGFMVLAVGNDGQFRSMASAIGQPELATDERFATNPQRVKHRLVLNQILEPLFAGQPKSHWTDLFRRNGVPATPVQNVDEIFQDPQVLLRGQVIHHEPSGLKTLGSPVLFEGQRLASRLPPPSLGPLIDSMAPAFEDFMTAGEKDPDGSR